MSAYSASPRQAASARAAAILIQEHIARHLFGLKRAVEDLLIVMLSGGHVLLEDVPGVGKTALAKSFSNLLGLSFHRVQCTPDLLPGEIVGGLIFNPKTAEFQLRKGPIFANILLVDEINRALPRTQSALLEAMAEGQVTIDGKTHPLPAPFFVMATQNPIESQGVFPLPEAQLDRFLWKASLGYPSAAEDIALLRRRWDEPAETDDQTLHADAGPIPGAMTALREAYASVTVTDEILAYLANIVQSTRRHPDVLTGASPRAMLMFAKAARAAAVIAGRTYVTPDDVKRVAPSVLGHRIIFQGYLGEGLTPAGWIESLLETIPVPVDMPDA